MRVPLKVFSFVSISPINILYASKTGIFPDEPDWTADISELTIRPREIIKPIVQIISFYYFLNASDKFQNDHLIFL